MIHLMDRIIVPAVQWSAAFVASWFMGVEPALWSYIIFVVIDVFTGVMASIYQGKPITSREWTRGLITKAGVLLFCLLGHPMELFLVLAGIPVELNLERWLPIGFTFGEILSVVENLYKCGVPIPAKLVQLLIKGKGMMVENATQEQMDELIRGAGDGATKDQRLTTQTAAIATALTAEKPAAVEPPKP